MAATSNATDRQSAFELDVIELAMLMHEAASTEFDLMEPDQAHQAWQVGLFMAANSHVAQLSPFISKLSITGPVNPEGKSFPTGEVTIKCKDEELTLRTDEHGVIPSFTLKGLRWSSTGTVKRLKRRKDKRKPRS